MVEADDETKGLEGVEEQYRTVAIQLRRLMKALEMKQDRFAEATGLRRTEISTAVNGGNLATTRRWINGIAQAAGVAPEFADSYLRGIASLDELLAQRVRTPGQLPLSGYRRTENAAPAADDLSPNAAAAMAGFDWTDVTRATYDMVHEALAAAHQAGGRDPFPSFWSAEIKRHIREAAGRPEKAVAGVTTEEAEAHDDADLDAHKRSRKKKK